MQTMRLVRFAIGRALIQAGLGALPPGRARSELYQLIDVWGTSVRATIDHARKGEG